MGATFANIQILNPDKENVDPAQFRQNVIDELVSLMDTLGFKRVESEESADRSVIISIPRDNTPWISIYDEETSRLESREIDNIACVLSNNMRTVVLGIMVYDDDLLFLTVYRNQMKNDFFANNEKDFDIDFTASDPEVWTGILKPGHTPDDIQTAWKERELFVTRFLQRFSSLVGIPEEKINTGYIYLLDEDLSQELYLHFARKAGAKTVELEPVKLSWISMSDSINIAIHAGMLITMTASVINKGLQSTGFEVMIGGRAVDDNLIRPETLRIALNSRQAPDNLLYSCRFYEAVSTTGVKLYCATLPDFEIKEGMKTPLPISMKEEQRYYSEMFNQAFNVEMDIMTLKAGEGDFDIFFVPLSNRQEGTAHFERRELQ